MNSKAYTIEDDTKSQNTQDNRLESLWFTIHNQDIETFKYLWEVGTQFFTTETIVRVLGNLTEHEWIEGMKDVMTSDRTKMLLQNLTLEMLRKFFKSLSDQIVAQKDYTKQYSSEDFLTIYEDLIEELELFLENNAKEDLKDQLFYSQDIIYAAGVGNLEIVQTKIESFEISQLGTVIGCKDICDTMIRVSSYVYRDSGEVYKEERMNPMTLALATNQAEVVKYFLESMPNMHLGYAWRRPSGSLVGYNNIYNIRDEVFPLICAICHNNLDLFSYLYTGYQNYFHHIHLRYL